MFYYEAKDQYEDANLCYDCNDCMINSQEITHAKDYMKEMIDMLFGETKFNKHELIKCIEEIGSTLGVSIPDHGNLAIESKTMTPIMQFASAFARENMYHMSNACI